MRKPILFASAQNIKGFCETFCVPANFRVKNQGITARFLEAWHRLERRETGRVNLTRFGELVGMAMGGGPVAASTVARWEKGAVPDLESIVAIAAVSGVNPNWLAFGLGSPDDPVDGEVVIRAQAPRGAVVSKENDLDVDDPIIPIGKRRGVVQKSVKDEIAAKQNPRKPTTKKKGA